MGRLKNSFMIGYYDPVKRVMYARDGLTPDQMTDLQARFLVSQCIEIAQEWGLSEQQLQELVKLATHGDVDMSPG